MYYIYFMQDGKKRLIDYGKYYANPKDASKRMRKLSTRYRKKCLIGYVPVV